MIDFKNLSGSENLSGLNDLNRHDNITGLNDFNSFPIQDCNKQFVTSIYRISLNKVRGH